MSRDVMQGQGPIFIHSLFRSGSTYLLSVFRRVPDVYYCFQEALHEIPLNCRNSPRSMLEITSDKYASINRHPHLGSPYFQELYDTRDAWMRVITKPMVYDDYFASATETDTSSYFGALAAASPRRPVFQECRTCGRIATLREKLGGFHIYLWRNPWDQWWSYKATDYFEIAQLQIINAINPPEVILALRREIGFESWHHESIGEEYNHFSSERPAPANSYLVFYILWCLGLLAGSNDADMMINIDSLSDIPEARTEATRRLVEAGVTGVYFDDCRITQAVFSAEEVAFFEAIEARAHYLLMRSGASASQLASLRELRDRHRPATQSVSNRKASGNDLSPQSFRALIQRIEDREHNRIQTLLNVGKEHTVRMTTYTKWLQSEWDVAKQRVEDLSQLIGRLEADLDSERQRTAQLGDELQKSRQRETELQARGDQLIQELRGLYASKSWRITLPLRKIAQTKRRVFALFTHTMRWAFRYSKRLTKLLMVWAMHYTQSHPRLKARALGVLAKHPKLKERLRLLALNAQPVQAPFVDPTSVKRSKRNPSPTSVGRETSLDSNSRDVPNYLSPRAGRIYAKLKKAIELQRS